MLTHWALPHHPMPFIIYVGYVYPWEICLTFLTSICFENVKHISHAWKIKTKKIKGMGWWGSAQCTCMSIQQKDLAKWIYAWADLVYALAGGSTWMSVRLFGYASLWFCVIKMAWRIFFFFFFLHSPPFFAGQLTTLKYLSRRSAESLSDNNTSILIRLPLQ